MSPATAPPLGVADLTSVRAGTWGTSTTFVSVAVIGSPPPGAVPVTEAVLVMLPTSTSAAVTV